MAQVIRDGERLLRENRAQEALACFAAESGAQARFGQAVALHLLARFDDAEAAYEEVLADGNNDEALSNLIALNIERFDLERVERHSRRLLERNGEARMAWQGLLVVAVERRDFEAAAECFHRMDGSAGPVDDRAIQYRLSRTLVDRLREMSKGVDGAITRSR
jgi:tetratricopeptide (TPR) repeat protein